MTSEEKSLLIALIEELRQQRFEHMHGQRAGVDALRHTQVAMQMLSSIEPWDEPEDEYISLIRKLLLRAAALLDHNGESSSENQPDVSPAVGSNGMNTETVRLQFFDETIGLVSIDLEGFVSVEDKEIHDSSSLVDGIEHSESIKEETPQNGANQGARAEKQFAAADTPAGTAAGTAPTGNAAPTRGKETAA